MGRWQSLRSSGRGRLRRIDEDSIDGSCGRRDRTDSLAGGRRVFLLNGGWNRRLNRGLKGRLRGRLNGRLNEQDKADIEKAFQKLQNRFLHGPISALAEEPHEGGRHTLLEALRKLFRLEE